MEITWLGHSCCRLRGREGIVLTDPYDPSLGNHPAKVNPSIVTVSHRDPFHDAVREVGGSPRIVDGPGEYEVAGVPLIGIQTYRDKVRGAQLGKNVVYAFDIEDMTVVHLGNLGHVPASEIVEQIGSVAVLLIPVGGRVTIDATAAVETISLIQPSYVIPIHFATPFEREELDGLDRFLREMGISTIEPQTRLMVNKSTLPEPTQVVVLAYPS